MADSAQTPFEPPTEERATILLSVDDDRDRGLLGEWLAAVPGYTVETAVDESAVYDLAFCDRASLARHAETLTAHAEAADPVFLPVVVGTTAEDGRETLPDPLDRLVDDVIALPTDKASLRRRLANLLRTRRASKRLAARENQYQRLVETTPEAILLLDGREVTSANAAAATLFGVEDAAAIVGRPVASFVAADGRARLVEALDRIETTGRLDEFITCEFERPDGERVVGSCSGVRVSRENGRATQLLIRDVTDERSRRERLHLFGRAIDAAAQGITIADARRENEPLIYANEAFDRITGYPVAEVLGRNCRFLQGDNTDPETVARLRAAIDAGRPVAVEILNYRKDGTPFWNQLELVPITENGEVTHFLGLQKDVTAKKERDEQLDVMSRVLRHNVRNRMNVIEGYAEMVDDEAVADRIRTASQELLTISDRVREFRELSAADHQTLESVELRDTLDRVVTELRATYPDATVASESTGDATVRGHPLLFSSIQETIESGLAERPDAHVTIRLRRQGDDAVIELADHDRCVPTGDLAALERGAEDPLEHPRGIELWLLRWVVFHTKGEFSVDADGDPPVVRMRLPVVT